MLTVVLLTVVLLASCTAAADGAQPAPAGQVDAGDVAAAPSVSGTVDASAADAPSAAASVSGSVPPVAGDATPDGDGAREAATVRVPLAIAVVVDGPPASVAGLGSVSTVVEYPAPRRVGGTVALAVTRADDGVVGPLRPASPRDVAVAESWGAALVTTRSARVEAGGLRVVEEGAPPGVVLRDPARRAPDNAYAVVASARDADLGEVVAPGPAWVAGPAPQAAGRRVDAVDVAAATPVTWTHDAVGGGWIRSVGGARTTTVDGGPVRAATVVVAETPRAAATTADGAAGPAVVLRDGRRYAARWVADGTGGGPAGSPALEQADGTAFPVEAPVWLQWCAPPCAQQIAPEARRPDAAER